MKTSTVLKRAKRLLETKGWTQGWYARDKGGNETSPLSDEAVCFCSVGAVERAAGADYAYAYAFAIDKLVASLPRGWTRVPEYSDAPRRTKAQVLALFDRAIASALKAEARK